MAAEPAEPGGALVVLRGSRRRWWMLLGISLATAAGNLWIAHLGAVGAIGCAALFGAVALLAGVHLLPGVSRLEIGRDGFAYRSPFRRGELGWAEVGPFSVVALSGRTWVAFDRRGRPRGWLGKLNAASFGANSVLPETYGQSPYSLADQMNAARDAALGARA